MSDQTYPLHPTNLTPADVEAGEARIVRCPDCGQMEIWTEDEIRDHGMCRTIGTCPICNDQKGQP